MTSMKTDTTKCSNSSTTLICTLRHHQWFNFFSPIFQGDLRLSFSSQLWKLSTLNQIFTKIARPLCNGLLRAEKIPRAEQFLAFRYTKLQDKQKIYRISQASLALQLKEVWNLWRLVHIGAVWSHMRGPGKLFMLLFHSFPTTEKGKETGGITYSTWINGCGWPCWPPETTTSLLEHSQ